LGEDDDRKKKNRGNKAGTLVNKVNANFHGEARKGKKRPYQAWGGEGKVRGNYLLQGESTGETKKAEKTKNTGGGKESSSRNPGRN